MCVYTGEVIRQFTVTELERLQTLPDGYTDAEGVTETARRKAIGNGWTTEVIAHIFKYLHNSTETRKAQKAKNRTKQTDRRFCPFKKQIVRKIKRDRRGAFPELRERFEVCASDRCMAYRDGCCLRLEKEVRKG